MSRVSNNLIIIRSYAARAVPNKFYDSVTRKDLSIIITYRRTRRSFE